MNIYCNERINEEYIRNNNIRPHDIIIIKNTVNQTSEDISKLPPNYKIRVIGGYDEEKDKRYASIIHKNRNTYDAGELAQILKKFEEYEEDIDPNWSDLSKALYIFTRLRFKMFYASEELKYINDPEYCGYGDKEFRSLRGIVIGKALCAGFAQIFKEFMDRQNIECKYRAKHGIHAWNEVEINGKYYPIDVTKEIAEKREYVILRHFMNNPQFYDDEMHKADDNERRMCFTSYW